MACPLVRLFLVLCETLRKEKYKIHFYQRVSDEFCSLCSACKRHADVRETMFDFRANSIHRTTGRLTNEQYMDSKAVEDLPQPLLHGVHISRFLHDTAHSQLLGTSKVLNASVLTYLCETDEFGPMGRGSYEPRLNRVLRSAFHDFKTWLRQNHLTATQPRFTASRLGRKARVQFPCLASKAVNGKRVSFWLASVCTARLQALGEESTVLDRLVATCIWTYCATLAKFDAHGMVLQPSEAESLHRVGMLHLLTYSFLRKLSVSTVGKRCNRSSWLILPKHHHLQHALDDALFSKVNPGSYHLLAAESFVGVCGRISRILIQILVSAIVLFHVVVCFLFL